MFDVSDLIDEATTSNRGTQCATCAWLRSRPDDERALWEAEMARSVDDRQHSAIHRAMNRAAELSEGKKPPSVSSVRKHRSDGHGA